MKLFKRITALVLTVFVCFYSAPMVFASDDDSVVIIRSEEEFESFVKNCTRDVWSKGRTVELQRDLNFSGREFTPIPVFQGTFHGNGHIIRGISFTQKGSQIGLFRMLTESASVENLIVDGTIDVDGSAAQVGLLAGENNGKIYNCSVSGIVDAKEDVGGIVGFNCETGIVESCVSAVKVHGTTNSGGIVGNNEGIVRLCTNKGEINTSSDQEVPSNVGGIAGLSRGVIQQCQNNGKIGYDHLGYNIGGIAGLQSGEIRDCSNTKIVKGRKDVGGIAGQMEPVHHLTYASSPIDDLNNNLASLFDQMESFVDRISSMTDQGAEDAKVVNEAVSNIQGHLYDAGREGLDDLEEVGDNLYSCAIEIRKSLDTFHEALNKFNDILGKLLDALPPISKTFDGASAGADADAKDALERIGEEASLAQKHLREIEEDFRAYEQFAKELVHLIEDGKTDPKFLPELPNTDISGKTQNLLDEIAKITEDVQKLAGEGENTAPNPSDTATYSPMGLVDSLKLLAQELHQVSLSFSNAVDTVIRQTQRAFRLIRDYGRTVNRKAQSKLDDIDDELSVIQRQVRKMTDSIQNDNKELHSISSSVFRCLDSVRNSIYNLTKKPELTVTDLSSEVTEGPGSIVGCISSGPVEGDSNTGGIVGTVSTERRSDPEATFLLDDFELLSDAYATLRAVIRECRFDGEVTVKNNYGGGIAGSCEAGAIVDCTARANVETGLDYCGGIVGRTKGTIERCAALADLKGESWVGGIAGFGDDISNCRSMIRSESDGEYQGAIAGETEGTLKNNRYLFEELAGLDGVDYAEKAQGLDFEEFSQLDHVPSDFLTFSYRFEVNGELIQEIPFEYGGDLDVSQIPPAPQQAGKYGQWPEYPTENLTRSMVLEAQFEEPTSVLSSGEEFAQILAQGVFAPSASISVKEKELPTEPLENEAVPVKAWSYSISGSKEDIVQIRLRTDGTKHPAAALYRNGGWIPVDATLDGSYLVFSAPVEGSVLLMEQKSTFPIPVVVGAAAVIVLILLIVVSRKKKHPTPPQLPQGEGASQQETKSEEAKEQGMD